MTAGVLAAHGVRTGAFLSPHLTTFAERVRVGDRDLAPDAFAAAVQRAAAAAAKVDRTLDEGDRVTQFELVTAAAFAEFARAGVEVAVVEAGLGGRWDATNVLGAPVVVLTNVGLEHTRWLGPTLTDIAQEKLAVLPRGATLVTGELEPEAEAVAAAVAAERDARRVRVGAAGTAGAAAALPGYQRENFAVAVAAAEALHGPARPGAGRRRRGARAGPRPPAGRRRDAAHGARRRAQPERDARARARAARRRRRPAARRGRLGPRRQGRRRRCCARSRRAAARSCSRARRTRVRCRPRRSPRSPASSATATRSIVPDPRRALARARELARRGRRRDRHGLDLPRRRPAQRAGPAPGVRAVSSKPPSVLSMVILVAVVVALVILVFFGLGYAFGRVFL